LARGQKPKSRILGDFTVDHADELVGAGGPVQPRVEVFEQPPGDVPEDVEFVDRAQQKGLVQHDGLTRAAPVPRHHRHLMAAMIAVAAIVAESKLIWYSYNYRALDRSVQGLLLSEADRLHGARVFRSSWDRADAFVLKGLVHAERAEAMDLDDFLMQGGPNDYFVDMPDVDRPEWVQVGVSGNFALYRRRD